MEKIETGKIANVGFIVGRFQPIHAGHLEMIDKALTMCNELIILVGSVQESRTLKNPFTFEERAKFIRRALHHYWWDDDGCHKMGRVTIIPLPDKGVGNNSEWGRYVLDTIELYTGMKPMISFSGNEERRASWYDGMGIIDIMVDKYKDYHATDVRKALIDTACEGWNEIVGNEAREYLHEALPEGLRDETTIGAMREVLEHSVETKTASI